MNGIRILAALAALALATPALAEIDASHVRTGTASTLSGANAEGSSVNLARADHNHAYLTDGIDFDDMVDSMALDSTLTITGTAGEIVRINRAFTDATSEDGLVLRCTALDTTSGTLTQNCLVVTNNASTEGADVLVSVNNADADDAVAAGIKFFDAGGGITNTIVLENGESISGATAATITFGRNDAGVVTITAKDNDATAALTILPGGVAALVLGGASTTAITLTTDSTGDGEVVLPAQSISGAEMLNDTVDGAQLADTIDLDADLSFTLGAAEQFIWNKTATDATGDYGAVFNYTASDTTGATTGQHALSITNAASTEAADSLLELDNADADDNVGKAILIANPSRFTSHFDMTGAAVFGSASVTGWTFTSDGALDADFVVPNTSIGASEIVLDAIDGAQLADILAFDATTLGFKNGSTGGVILNWHDYADTADDDMAHVVMTTNCTDVGTGAEDCDYSIGVVEAGAAAETRFLIDADAGIVIGSANTNSIDLTTSATGDAAVVLPVGAVSTGEILLDTILAEDIATGAVGTLEIGDDVVDGVDVADVFSFDTTLWGLRNASTGDVTLNFHDYADTADDDMAHVVMTTNCTTATAGAEDCDFSIGVVEGGAAAETRFSIDADGGVAVGSANNDSFTVTTDGTGTGEVVLPLQSIEGAELVNDTVDGAQLADTITLDAALTIAGAFAIDIGNNTATSVTIDTDGTGDSEFVVPLLSISGGEMADDTVDGAQLADTITLDANFAVNGKVGASGAAGGTIGATGGVGGVAAAGADGQAGGAVAVTGGLGTVLNGAGTNDGNGGDVVLLGGAKGGATGTAVDGVVRVGSPTIGGTKATNYLAVGGGFEVDGAARFDGTAAFNSTTTFQTGDITGTEILDGTIEAVDEAFAGRGQIVICGTLDTIASNTVYYGPNTAVTATAIGGMTCDTTATGNVTEATADAPAFAAKAFHVRGMVCRNADTNVTEVTYALRTAASATTPSVTCSVGDGVLDCVADVQTTTAIASGATIAVAATEADEAVGAVVFVCVIDIAY